AHDGAGPASPYLRPHLRAPGRRAGPQALSGLPGAQPQDQQCRACGAGRRLPAGLPPRRGIQLQPLHRHPRPHHRGRQRPVARRLPRRAHSDPARDGRDRLLDRRGQCQQARRALPGRSLDRRQGRAVQHAGAAGDGIRRRRP
ncbi:hypothetical protein KXW38_002058, partial [Aspergillus fumigatus]